MSDRTAALDATMLAIARANRPKEMRSPVLTVIPDRVKAIPKEGPDGETEFRIRAFVADFEGRQLTEAMNRGKLWIVAEIDEN